MSSSIVSMLTARAESRAAPTKDRGLLFVSSALRAGLATQTAPCGSTTTASHVSDPLPS